MKKTLKRITCAAFAALMSLSCFLIPASAATEKLDIHFGETNPNFTYIIFDENGVPVSNSRALPVQGATSIPIKPNNTLKIFDYGGGYFNITGKPWITFDASFSSRAGLDFGCELSSGAQWWKYSEPPSTTHSGNFKIDTDGSMIFILKNTSASSTVLTSLYIG